MGKLSISNNILKKRNNIKNKILVENELNSVISLWLRKHILLLRRLKYINNREGNLILLKLNFYKLSVF